MPRVALDERQLLARNFDVVLDDVTQVGGAADDAGADGGGP